MRKSTLAFVILTTSIVASAQSDRTKSHTVQSLNTLAVYTPNMESDSSPEAINESLIQEHNYSFWEIDGTIMFVNDQEPKLTIEINKSKQWATVVYKDVNGRLNYFEFPVSTGGGLKKPKDLRFSPYCANTPIMDKIIPIKQSTTPDRFQDTLFRHYTSGEFEVDMPFALRISDRGHFTHEVPAGGYNYRDRNGQQLYRTFAQDLGRAVSGGCVRMPSKEARVFYELATRVPTVRVRVYGENPDPRLDEKCARELPQAIAEWEAIKANPQIAQAPQAPQQDNNGLFGNLFRPDQWFGGAQPPANGWAPSVTPNGPQVANGPTTQPTPAPAPKARKSNGVPKHWKQDPFSQ